MTPPFVYVFIGGFYAMGYVVVGAFFLRFWRATRDALFLWFALAFAMIAAGEGVSAYFRFTHQEKMAIYLLRLAAFILINIAILTKNLGPRRR